jgi:hypothetical protein
MTTAARHCDPSTAQRVTDPPSIKPPERFPGESRDPPIGLMSARRVDPGFRRGSVFIIVERSEAIS